MLPPFDTFEPLLIIDTIWINRALGIFFPRGTVFVSTVLFCRWTPRGPSGGLHGVAQSSAIWQFALVNLHILLLTPGGGFCWLPWRQTWGMLSLMLRECTESIIKTLEVVSFWKKSSARCCWHHGVDFIDCLEGKHGECSLWCCTSVWTTEMGKGSRVTDVDATTRAAWPWGPWCLGLGDYRMLGNSHRVHLIKHTAWWNGSMPPSAPCRPTQECSQIP